MPKRYRIAGAVLLTWVPLVILTAAAGVAAGSGVGVPLLFDYIADVRFLVALPVLVGAEGLVWGKVVDLAQYLVRSGVVAESRMPALEQLVVRFHARRKSWLLPGLAAIGVAFGVIFLRREYSGDLSTWQFVPGSSDQVRSAAGWWYLLVSVPVFQFLMLYWALRYVLWCWFLYRLSRLDLVLIPSHPDRSGGLRPIGQVHQYWSIVVFAISSLVSASVGLEIVHGRSPGDYRVELIAFLVLSLVVLFAPLLVFAGKLLDARMRGLLAYGELAAAYTRRFDAKWVHARAGGAGGSDGSGQEPLLGSADIQSLADLANSYEVVREMRFVPFDMLNVLIILLAVALPFVPLVFAAVSPIEIARKVMQILL